MKKVTGFIKLQVPAGKANPSPPIGPALGQHGVNIMEFCKQFNARTQAQAKDDVTIPVEITVYSDRSFTFITKTPPAPILIKKAAGLATQKKPGSGSKEPNKVKVGKISQKQLRDIATTKMPDLNTTDLEAAMRTIAGTARSMGIEVEGLSNVRGIEEQTMGHSTERNSRTPSAKVDRSKRYSIDEACKLVPETKVAKFDESVDIAVRLGVDPKHADQMVRGAVVLPHGTGKSQRVVVVAKGDKANEARAAGADAVGAEDLVEKIQKENWTDFDSMVATPDMMGLVGRLGRVLGPKGLMPNPKVGTVTNDVAKAVRELKAGRVEFRVEKAGIVQARIGKASFGGEKLRDNARTMIETLLRLKPASAKGTYMRSVTVSTTMGPGIKIDHLPLVAEFETK